MCFSSIRYRDSKSLDCCGFTVFLIQFFQWADCTSSVGLNHHGGSRIRLNDPAAVTTHLRQHRVMFYCQSQFLQKSLENILSHFKNVSSTCHVIISFRSYEKVYWFTSEILSSSAMGKAEISEGM